MVEATTGSLREILSNAVDDQERPRGLTYNGLPLWPDIGVPAKAILAEKARAAIDAAHQVKEGQELLEVLVRGGAVDG